MQCARIPVLLTLLALFSPCLAADPSTLPPAGEAWKPEGKGGGVDLYSRPRPNSSLKEFKGVGEIAAPAQSVHAVIDDFENYAKFMPFTVECRVIKREGGETFFYQRLSPKIVSDRDYTLRIREKSWRGQQGSVYQHSFEAANELGPAEQKGYTRVKVCQGKWIFEPIDPNKTRVTYFLDTDNGGKVPAFIANPASEMAIRKVFAAVRKQVKDPKYAVAER
jgi:ribosome-associated toxin RatA of RatAB toxin-antitoxin module